MKTLANADSKKLVRSSKKRGQGMTEYIILVALIGIAPEAIAGDDNVVNRARPRASPTCTRRCSPSATTARILTAGPIELCRSSFDSAAARLRSG